MGEWHQVGDIWERLFDGGFAAYVRIWRYRWQIAIAPRPGVPLAWQDYCSTVDAAGGCVCQEYKAKRRATALARKYHKEEEDQDDDL